MNIEMKYIYSLYGITGQYRAYMDEENNLPLIMITKKVGDPIG